MTATNKNTHLHTENKDINCCQNDDVSAPKFSRQNMNDFLIITQHRAREYMK